MGQGGVSFADAPLGLDEGPDSSVTGRSEQGESEWARDARVAPRERERARARHGLVLCVPTRTCVSNGVARIHFLTTWLENGMPASFWLPGFYSPQAFLTGVKQNFARKHAISIDLVDFSYLVVNPDVAKEPPQEGAYIHGSFSLLLSLVVVVVVVVVVV